MANEKTEPTESQRFRAAMREIVSVPKAEIDRRELAYREDRKRIKARRGKR